MTSIYIVHYYYHQYHINNVYNIFDWCILKHSLINIKIKHCRQYYKAKPMNMIAYYIKASARLCTFEIMWSTAL